MKVKDFIEWIRPLTAINPDTDLVITNFQVPCDVKIEKIIIDNDVVTLSILPVNAKYVE